MDTDEACPLPSTPKQDEAATIRRLLAAKRIAIVGLSDDSSRPSYGVATYLQAHGFEVLPVNPNCTTVLGLRCYPTLAEVPGPIDLVDVFRRPRQSRLAPIRHPQPRSPPPRPGRQPRLRRRPLPHGRTPASAKIGLHRRDAENAEHYKFQISDFQIANDFFSAPSASPR